MAKPWKRSIASTIVFSLFVAAALAAFLWSLQLPDLDRYVIDFERAKRRAYISLGLPLPGTPNLADLRGRLDTHGLALGAPVLIRIFKREFELELWMLRDGRFHRFATYPICRWSGWLGPKLRQGDRQAPEGFYAVGREALNANSRWHRSFNLGFPNLYDRARGRSGSLLMVHGGCSSIGCYAMTDPVIEEIWSVITAAFDAGQKQFQAQVFPFRMTERNIARRTDDSNAAFWTDLKRGHDLFDAELLPPRVNICRSRYSFESGEPPSGAKPDGNAQIEGRCPSAPSSS